MTDATDEMIGRVVRTVEYNTGNGASEAISAAQIRVHLCANSTYPVEAVNQAIVAALERGDLVEQNGEYAPSSPDTCRSTCRGIHRPIGTFRKTRTTYPRLATALCNIGSQ